MLTAAAMALTATPALANGGHLGLSYDLNDTDVGADDIKTWQVDGRYGFDLGALGAQVDGSIGTSDDDAGTDVDHWALDGHLFFQGTGWRLGGGIATSNSEFGGGGGEADEVAYGIEGTFDVGANTVLSGSYAIGETDIGIDFDTTNFDAGVTFYPSANFKVYARGGVGSLDAGGGADFDTSTIGFGAEFAPWAAPVSFTVGYQQFEVDDLFGGLDAESIGLGVRWNLGGGTIRDRDNAAPFDLRTGLYQRALNLR